MCWYVFSSPQPHSRFQLKYDSRYKREKKFWTEYETFETWVDKNCQSTMQRFLHPNAWEALISQGRRLDANISIASKKLWFHKLSSLAGRMPPISSPTKRLRLAKPCSTIWCTDVRPQTQAFTSFVRQSLPRLRGMPQIFQEERHSTEFIHHRWSSCQKISHPHHTKRPTPLPLEASSLRELTPILSLKNKAGSKRKKFFELENCQKSNQFVKCGGGGASEDGTPLQDLLSLHYMPNSGR